MEQPDRKSPHARITGMVYLLYFVAAISAQLLIDKGFVATGNALNLLGDALYITVTLLFYRLFRPVNQKLSLLAALFSFAGCAVTVMAQIHLDSLQLSPLIFFGPFCLLIGYLIFRSIFLPRFLGILLMLAGAAWIIYIIPGLPKMLLVPIQVLGILAEAFLMLWLIAIGIKPEKWPARTPIGVSPSNPQLCSDA
jgi:hypothetical protein